jgi:hypothetical protein
MIFYPVFSYEDTVEVINRLYLFLCMMQQIIYIIQTKFHKILFVVMSKLLPNSKQYNKRIYLQESNKYLTQFLNCLLRVTLQRFDHSTIERKVFIIM